MKIRMRAFGICLIIAVLLLAISVAPLHLATLSVVNKVSAQGGSGERTPTRAPKPPAKPKTTTVKRAPPARTTSSTSAARSSVRRSVPEIEMVRIPAGTFTMGSPDSEAGRSSDEGPQHEVRVQSFYMGKYEVTQAQYRAVMGANPSNFKGDNLPVEQVSWNDAVEFCRKLSQMTGRDYRLPSEAEWEYACRAGTSGPYAGNLDAMAWYGDNSGRQRLDTAEIWRTDSSNYVTRLTNNGNQTHPVGSKQVNGFGLYDMHGNVWEWCEDWYHASYNGAPSDSSAWESGGSGNRVLRGGARNDLAYSLRSAYRFDISPDGHNPTFGFRVAASPRS